MNESVPKEARYELKFVSPPFEFDRLLTWIRLNSACFHTSFDDRLVNNVYFDTYNFTAYNENLSGTSERQKLRYRWYGDDVYPSKGNLEIKCRRNVYGWKKSFKILNDPYIAGDSWDLVKKRLKQQLDDKVQLWIDCNPQVVITNRYLRKYFVSSDGKIRITVDRDLKVYDQRYCSTPNVSRESNIPGSVILEFKCHRKDRNLVSSVINTIPIRVSRNSKYVNAVTSINRF